MYMKTFEAFNNIDKEIEELFLELSHIDELDIKFDFREWTDSIFYFYGNIVLFEQELLSHHFWINDKKIYNVIKKEFDLNSGEINMYMDGMIEKHLNIHGYSIKLYGNMMIALAQNHFIPTYTNYHSFLI